MEVQPFSIVKIYVTLLGSRDARKNFFFTFWPSNPLMDHPIYGWVWQKKLFFSFWFFIRVAREKYSEISVWIVSLGLKIKKWECFQWKRSHFKKVPIWAPKANFFSNFLFRAPNPYFDPMPISEGVSKFSEILANN